MSMRGRRVEREREGRRSIEGSKMYNLAFYYYDYL